MKWDWYVPIVAAFSSSMYYYFHRKNTIKKVFEINDPEIFLREFKQNQKKLKIKLLLLRLFINIVFVIAATGIFTGSVIWQGYENILSYIAAGIAITIVIAGIKIGYYITDMANMNTYHNFARKLSRIKENMKNGNVELKEE